MLISSYMSQVAEGRRTIVNVNNITPFLKYLINMIIRLSNVDVKFELLAFIPTYNNISYYNLTCTILFSHFEA